MSKFFRGSARFLASPFTHYFADFILLLLLLGLPSLFALIYNDHYTFSAYMLAASIVECYVFTLPLWLLRSKTARRIYRAVVWIYAVAWCAMVLFCVVRMHVYFSMDLVPIILGTNFQEGCEFLTSYIEPSFLLMLIAFLAVSFGIYHLMARYKVNCGSVLTLIGVLAVAVGIMMVVHNTAIIEESSIGRTYGFISYERITPERLITNPDIEVTDDKIDRIAVVIGESLAKSHCSLYGYEKETNPRLKALADSVHLLLFDSVTAAYPTTAMAFQRIMSTYDGGANASRKWYRCPNIPEILHKGGYTTHWISNQSRYGVFDNIPSSYASVCDTAIFVGDKFAGVRKVSLDEEVIAPIDGLKGQPAPSVDIVHLLGSHPAFSARYPSDRARWKAEDYTDKPSHQRQRLAEYDNTVLYNDSVVSEIIRRYANDDAIVIYFPDHGMDMFESTPDFCGHANPAEPISLRYALDIPFVVYVTDKFIQKHPKKYAQLRESRDNTLNTSHFIYTLMDIAGLRFADAENGGKSRLTE